MACVTIFFNETSSALLEIENSHQINEEFSTFVHMLEIVVTILILILVTPALSKLHKADLTFINGLVILDCLNSAGHVLVVIQTHQYALI